jgi:hypothetical protein
LIQVQILAPEVYYVQTDIILKENLVSVEDKIKVIKVVKNTKFLDYYENSIEKKGYDKQIDDAAQSKLEEIFRKAVIE